MVQKRLPIVYVARTPNARMSPNRLAVAWCVVARDHIGEFEVNWSHRRDEMVALALRIKDAIRFAKGKAISDEGPPCVEEPPAPMIG